MILKADISKTSPGRYLFLFIFMCGNSKCTRIQKIKNFSGEVNWVHQALKLIFNDRERHLTLKSKSLSGSSTHEFPTAHCLTQQDVAFTYLVENAQSFSSFENQFNFFSSDVA